MRCLSVVLVLMLAACGTAGLEPEVRITAPGNFKAGSGTIQSVAVVHGASPNRYRLSIQMDVGGFQTVDVDTEGFMAGQAVELTNDGRVVRVSGTALMKGRESER